MKIDRRKLLVLAVGAPMALASIPPRSVDQYRIVPCNLSERHAEDVLLALRAAESGESIYFSANCKCRIEPL